MLYSICIPCWCVVSFEVDTILTLFLTWRRITPNVMLEMANNMVNTMNKIAVIIHIMFVVTLSAAWWKEHKLKMQWGEIPYIHFKRFNDKFMILITTLHQLCTLLHSKQIHYDILYNDKKWNQCQRLEMNSRHPQKWSWNVP